MGSEKAPTSFFSAISTAVSRFSDTEILVLYATAEILAQFQSYCQKHRLSSKLICFEPCEEVIDMKDSPLRAIRKKKSTMILAMDHLRDGALHALISAGNTGALVAGATIKLSRLPEMEKLALLAMVPTQRGYVAVTDVGANISCRPAHLAQFAKVGAAYLRSCGLRSTPKIGLLNIGAESKKGTAQLWQTHQLLTELCQRDSSMRFIGNIEGKELFLGEVDVVVTDGFTGNIFLKTSEGVSHFILQQLQSVSPDLHGSIQSLQRLVSNESYPGAIMCGLKQLLIKCHGDSSPQTIAGAIERARSLLQADWLRSLQRFL